MFFFLPLGHEFYIRRTPKITIGLIVVCAAVFLLTHFVMNSEERNLKQRFQELILRGMQIIMESESTGGDPMGFLFSLPEFKEKARSPEGALAFIAERMDKENSRHREWLEDFEDFKRFRADMLIYKIGFIPARFPGAGFFTHMFVHGGWLHIIFNMWFLYLVGCCLEDTWGRFNFLGFYILGGLAAAFLHYLYYPMSTIPLVGASGAVAAAMGAFAIRHGKEKINCLFLALFLFRPIIRQFKAPAWLLLVLWFGVQLFWAHMYTTLDMQAGVAFWAHVGGFAFGGIFAFLLGHWKIEEKVIRPKLEKLPEYQPDFHQDPRMIVALDLMSEKKFDEARSKIDEALESSPQNPDALVIKARLLAQTENTEEAKAIYILLMEDAKAKAQRGWLAMLYREFRAWFEEAPLASSLRFTAGRACFEKHDVGSALHAFHETIKTDEESDLAARSLFYIARMKLEIEENPTDALVSFQQFIIRYPEHAWVGQARSMLERISRSQKGVNGS